MVLHSYIIKEVIVERVCGSFIRLVQIFVVDVGVETYAMLFLNLFSLFFANFEETESVLAFWSDHGLLE